MFRTNVLMAYLMSKYILVLKYMSMTAGIKPRTMLWLQLTYVMYTALILISVTLSMTRVTFAPLSS